jgi:hypothetical protein
VATIVPVAPIIPTVIPTIVPVVIPAVIAAIVAPGIVDIAIVLIVVSVSLVHIILHRLEVQASFEIVGIGWSSGEGTADYGDCCGGCAQ